ncbi:MAG: FAD-binding oxidoreductase [Ktedonobacteraceae bacterium]|nr:FAD-binding oxidoreductase [Ktedonobacteraceae bacterium]
MSANHEIEPSHSANEPASYWQRTAVPFPISGELPRTVDALVVGCGVFGAAVAYWLARSGRRVVLLDRVAVAHGASGRNGGFVVAGMAEDYPAAIRRLGQKTAQAVMAISYENQALLRGVLAEEEIDCQYREPGSLGLAPGEEQFSHLRSDVEALQADGFSAQLLARDEVQELIRTPLAPEITGGKFLPGQALVHSAKLVQGLVQAAQRRGAQVYRAQALRLVQDSNSVLVETNVGRISTGSVVLAVNAWTDELITGIKGKIVPVRGQALAYAPLKPVFTTAVFASLTETGEYWQQTPDGSIVLGGCRAHAPGRDVGVREPVPTAEVQAALEQIFPRLFPQLGGLQVVQRWAGLMAFTPDRIPIVDRVPGLANAWFVGGLSGHGMPFSMLISQMLAEAVQSDRTPARLLPFRLDRETISGTDHHSLLSLLSI